MSDLYDRYPSLLKCKDDIETAIEILIEAYKNGGKVLICGNGGSASDSEHIVGELMKGFLKKRPVNDNRIDSEIKTKLQGGLPAISLVSQSAILSAYANDCDPNLVYGQLVYGYGNKNDVLIGLSTSGNSKNVVNAIKVAKSIGLKTIGLTGINDSKVSELCDVTIKVPESETYKIQELHLPVYHEICIRVEDYFFHE